MTRLIIFFLTLFAYDNSAQCVFEDLVLEQTACDLDNSFDVAINFEYANIGDLGFRVQGNGQSYGVFAYSELPILIENLPGNCTTNWEFNIKDVQFPDCSIEDTIGTVCCNGDCALEIVEFFVSDCVNGGFSIALDVETFEDSNLGADIYINGAFYEYVPYENFPATFDDVPSLNDLDNTLVVCDNDNLMCCDTVIFESPCSCNIKNSRGRITECNDMDSLYNFTLDFETNMVSDSFMIGGNGIFLGVHAYADLPLQVGPIPFHSDTAYYLIADQKNTFCFDELIIRPVTECDTACIFENIVIDTTACENGEYYALISFDANNPGLNGFRVIGNGVVYEENLPYGLSVYEIGPLQADCITTYEFILIDEDIESCNGETFLSEPLCCLECKITELEVALECDNNKVDKLIINFNHNNSIDSMFFVEINEGTFGPFSTLDLPITIDVDLPGMDEIRVLVYDSEDESCRKVRELIPECGPGPCAEYFNINTEFSECNDNNTFSVFVSFEIEGMQSDSFFIGVKDQVFGPFMHGEMSYEVGPLVSDCKRTILKFIDEERPDCLHIFEIDEIKCCDEGCEIGEYDIVVDCEEGEMVGFEIKVFPKGSQSSKYEIILGDKEYGPFEYGEFHYIENSLANGTYSILIRDIEFPDCAKEVSFEVNCGDDCEIGEVSVSVDCEDGKMIGFTIIVNKGGNLGSQYEFTLKDIKYGPFEYGESVYVARDLADGTYTMNISDVEFAECKKEIGIEVACEEGCEIGEVNIEIDCKEGEFVGFTIKVNKGGSLATNYLIKLENEDFGPFEYGSVAYIESDLPDGTYTILIKDREYADCTKEVSLKVDCDDKPDCKLENLTASAINCTDETFMFQVNASYGFAESDLFQLFINGELIGTSSYSLLPINSSELNRDFNDAWKILIKDLNNPDCFIELVIEDEICESNTDEVTRDLKVVNHENRLQLSSNNNQYTSVKLFNIMGVQIHNGVWSGKNDYFINTSNLQRGIGILVLESNGKRNVVKVLF